MFPEGERVNSRGVSEAQPPVRWTIRFRTGTREFGYFGLFPEGERVNSRGPAKRSPRCERNEMLMSRLQR